MSQHRLSAAFLIAAATAGYGQAVQRSTDSTAAIDCRPCPSPSNVILMIGLPSENGRVRTMTRLWIEKHARAAQQLHEEHTGETIPVVTRSPANVAEFREEVQQLANDCKRIERLGIMSHGNVGYLLIGGDGVAKRNVDDAFGRGMSCAMAPNASVEMAGCNVGRGCRGAEFMLAVADRLLPDGGSVVAPEHYVYGNALLGIAPQSILGDRELKVGAGASLARWTRGSQPGSECGNRSQMSSVNGHSSQH